MDFRLSDDQNQVLQEVRRYCRERIAPLAAEYDRSGNFPRLQLAGLAELGLLGATIPEVLGGAGLDNVTFALALEEVAAADPSVAVIVSVQNSLPEQMLWQHGTSQQHERFLRPLAGGAKLGAFALTEPNAGSDAASLTTRAEREDEDWVLTGQKAWITSGGQADLYLVMARTDSGRGARGIGCFVVERGAAGLTFGAPEEKLGLHAAHTTAVHLDGVRVPPENVLGAPDEGLVIALSSLDSGRIGIAMQAVGIARAALEVAREYALTRVQFGKRLADHEGVAFKIADMAVQVDSARLLALRAAALKDQGRPFTLEAAMAKLAASNAAVSVTRDAVQILGANGYSRAYPVERLYRDAKVTEIYEGTSEIQRLVISRHVFGDPRSIQSF